jgi:uncharacterized membrane protein
MPLPAAVGAMVAAGLSLAPSLMPRSGPIQGIVSGLAAATGYGIGLLLAWVIRELTGRPRGTPSARTWHVVLLAGAVILAGLALLGRTWQDDVRELMGSAIPSAAWYPQALVVALLVMGLIVGSARLVRRLAHAITAFAGRHLPRRASRAVGVLAAAGVTLVVVDGLVVEVAYPVLDRTFVTINDIIDPDVAQPASTVVSGSAASVVTWEDLGAEGRAFIAGVPSDERIAEVAAPPRAEPVRVFVGLDADPDPTRRAELAVADLESFGAFDRAVLLVVTSTGTGWVDQRAVEPVELMYGGDSAVVSTQYSHLPSWLSFVVDQQRAQDAARALFDAVYARWSQLPEGDRPRLLVYGESLGSFGAESAFTGISDMVNRTDGLLLVGPPSVSPIHESSTDAREPGSPQWQPIVDGGRTLRFASTPEDLAVPREAWQQPRLVYLQNASDPVVWWSVELLFTRPDWLSEPRGPDVSPHLRWWPILTFLQLAGDMMDSTSVPEGHGHVYGSHQAAAWSQIAPPPGWTDADTARLVDLYR